MIRTFNRHHLRSTLLLDGQWAFATDPAEIGREQGWATEFPQQRSMYVPSCWNNELGLFDYEGVAWYQTTFINPSGKHLRLVFHGVLGEAEIYVDGTLIGSHYGSFTAFEFLLHDVGPGAHTLVVRTDNRHTRQTIPLERVDWFHYGGIIRSVELQELPDVSIADVRIAYTLDCNQKKCRVNLACSLRSFRSQDSIVPIVLCINDVPREAAKIAVKASAQTEYVASLELDDVKLWDIGQPNLYTFRLSTDEDDWVERTGFREVKVVDSEIQLNGKAVFFKGVNRHEEHPEWGFAFPPKLMKKDLDIITQLGCNSVRGSHYPNSAYWLDLLDEHGIMFWSEIPLWQYGKTHMSDSVVQQRALAMLEDMIEENRQHPSILFWSVNNECATETEEGLIFNQMLVNRVRELDNSRLVTFATDRAQKDITLSLYDVIGINKYYGWYGGETEEFESFLQQYKAYAETVEAAGKPVIMAEFGGAGIFGDVGWEEHRMFSEDYQSDILEKALRIFRKDDQVVGTFIWQFADVRSDTPRFRDRARGFNNKGIVNEYRKPKLAYRTVKQIYRSWED